MFNILRKGELGPINSEMMLAIQRGKIRGAKIYSKYGYNYAVGSTGGMQTLWDGSPVNSGVYTYALDTPALVDIYSSDDSDNQSITVEGLDPDGYEISEDIILNGLTAVTTTKEYYRIYRAYNNDSTNFIGNIEGFVTGSILEEDQVLYISSDAQQTLFAGFTIPKGKTGYAFQYGISTGKGKETRVGVYKREYGGVFRVHDMIVNYESGIVKNVPFIKLNELTDLEVRAIADADNTNVGARFDILLLDNDLFSS